LDTGKGKGHDGPREGAWAGKGWHESRLKVPEYLTLKKKNSRGAGEEEKESAGGCDLVSTKILDKTVGGI